jgi:alpha-L-rhamnosidase
VAFKLLLSDTYPSWGYMVKKGATTWWERWNGDTGDPSMNSYNHYAFGSVMAWVYRRAAGIDTYGTVVSDWKQSEKKFTIKIPANTTATVILPEGKSETVGSGTHTYEITE